MKSAHEKLENWIRTNIPGRFTPACAKFGETLEPPTSGVNVFKWCRTGVVPRGQMRKVLFDKTGIDFGVNQISEKKKPATSKHTPSVSPVDFQDLQWVRTETPCVGCFIDGGSDECENAVRAITGQKCKSRGFVLKRKQTWEICTKQNTKVGDVVRIIGGTYEYEVRYIMNGVGEAEMIVRSLDPLLIDRVQKMHHCEVEV